MSRSGYGDGDGTDSWYQICWRGAVNSAIRGKRGQNFLNELLQALDDMPNKELITDELVRNGSYCTLGVIGAKRGLDLEAIDYEDSEKVAEAFNIANALVCEIEYMNDEGVWYDETPAERWIRMRNWIENKIKTTKGNE